MNSFPSSPSKTPMPLQPAPQPHYPPRSVPTQHTPTPSHVQSSPPPPQPLKRKVGSLGLDSPRMQGMGVGSMGPPQQNGYTLPQTPTPYRDGVQHVNGAMGAERTPQRTSTFPHPQAQPVTPQHHSAPGTLLRQSSSRPISIPPMSPQKPLAKLVGADSAPPAPAPVPPATGAHQLPPLPATLVQNKSFTQITVVPLLTSLSQIPPLFPSEIKDVQGWMETDR